MPIYIAKLLGCDCAPMPEVAFRADGMVSAVMVCQEKIEILRIKAEENKVELHNPITIIEIAEADFELMDEEGIETIVDVWKVVAEAEK